jgi:dihydroxyacetone kinase-like predicted kinase
MPVPSGPVATATDAPALGVIAVTAGDGLAAIFHEFGVAAVVQGGQSANPSTGELLEAIGAVDAREIIVLPNNPNVVLAARQVAAMCDRPVVVVPTRNAAEGFAALLALDPGLDAAANAGPMGEAARTIQTVVVTDAVRDATIGGRKVKRGQTIALDPDDGLVASAATATKVVLAARRRADSGLRAAHAVLRGRRRPRRDGETMARRIGAVTPVSRSRSATAGSRSTGT